MKDDRVFVTDGTYIGCRGTVVSNSGRVIHVYLDACQDFPRGFLGAWSKEFLVKLSPLDLLAENA